MALAEALQWSHEEKILVPGTLAKWFAPRLAPFMEKPFGANFASSMNNPPAYVIGCGRQAALATRLLKKSGSFAIQILDPRLDTRHWDVVIVTSHDEIIGHNVIQSIGSLHDVNAGSLNQWREEHPVFGKLDAPRTSVLIGGPSRMASFNEGLIEVMFSHLEYELARNGGSLIICGSRRTPKKFAEKIRARFSDSGYPIWFDESDNVENTYHQALAYADRIVVTPDSVNMISEACATQVPVYIAQPERATGRMKVFMDHLLKIGRVTPQSALLKDYPVTALNTMPDVITRLERFLHQA